MLQKKATSVASRACWNDPGESQERSMKSGSELPNRILRVLRSRAWHTGETVESVASIVCVAIRMCADFFQQKAKRVLCKASWHVPGECSERGKQIVLECANRKPRG